MESSQENFKGEIFADILEQIQKFRDDPNSFLDKVEFLKKKKKIEEYKTFINTLQKMNPLIPDKELYKIAEEEMKKLSEDSDYQKYQIGTEFQNDISKDFVQNEVALIAIEEIEKIEEIIQKLIVNDLDKEKKGRAILTNNEYTHIGICKSEEEASIILIFAKKEMKQKEREESNAEHVQEEKTKEEEVLVVLTEEENKIINQIKEFRENPKSFLDKKVYFKSNKKKKEYATFIETLDKMNELKLNKELCDIAKEEIKILSEDEDGNYEKIQIGEKFKPKISEIFSLNEVALLAIEEIEKAEEIVPKIIVNDLDTEKKGRDILTNNEYTHIGISISEESSIILIFAKMIPKEESKKEEEKPVELTEEENMIINQIKEFRENPKSFLDKKVYFKANKKKKEYATFIETLDKMNELKPNKELCDIAKEEVKLLNEDDNYEKIQIGENVKSEIKEKLSNEEIAILVIEEIENIEDIIPKIIVNDLDKEKQGRNILTDNSYTHIGLSRFCPDNGDEEDDKPIIIIFSKNIDKEKIEKKDKEKDKKSDENKEGSETKEIKKEITKIDNNEANEMNIEEKDNNIIENENENENKNEPEKQKEKNNEEETNNIIENENEKNNEKKTNNKIENKNEKNNFQQKMEKDEPKNTIKNRKKEEDSSKNNENTITIEEEKDKVDSIPKDKNTKKKGDNKEVKTDINKNKSNTSKNNVPLEDKIDKNSNSKKHLFFFTSMKNDIKITKIQIVDKNQKIIKNDNFEYQEETVELNNNKSFRKLFIKLNLEKYNSFYLYIYYSNKNYYKSDEIKITKNNYLLGHIRLYSYRNPVEQLNYPNELILSENINLLKKFKSENIYMKFAFEKYIPDKYISLYIIGKFTKNNEKFC